jgi:Family of unknown function (DUF5302)
MASDDPSPDHPEDEVKTKFRDALARKRGQQAARAADADGKDGSKIHGTHGSASTQRTFRRKSG